MSDQQKLRAFFLMMTCSLVTGATGAFAWQLAQRPAKDYIASMDKPDRVLKIDEVIAKLELKPGDIVAGIGAGSGSFSIPMAKAIAPNGILYAADIDQTASSFFIVPTSAQGRTA